MAKTLNDLKFVCNFVDKYGIGKYCSEIKCAHRKPHKIVMCGTERHKKAGCDCRSGNCWGHTTNGKKFEIPVECVLVEKK